MARDASTIGFDRKVRTDWLDAVATRHANGMRPAELRRFAHRMLGQVYPEQGARGKTLTVIFHLWVNVPKKAVALRDAAESYLLQNLDAGERLALHWGLGIATYPFFCDMAHQAGRLFAAQEAVSTAALQGALAPHWGEGPTVTRAAHRIVHSWLDWGVLRETGLRGVYGGPHRVTVSEELQSWLASAVLVGNDSCSTSALERPNALFPFELAHC